jgi:hypothetical protein
MAQKMAKTAFQYLSRDQEDGSGGETKGEEPTRLFAGLGLVLPALIA